MKQNKTYRRLIAHHSDQNKALLHRDTLRYFKELAAMRGQLAHCATHASNKLSGGHAEPGIQDSRKATLWIYEACLLHAWNPYYGETYIRRMSFLE